MVREDEIVAALKNNPIVSQGAEGNKSGTLYLITDKKSGRFRSEPVEFSIDGDATVMIYCNVIGLDKGFYLWV